MQYLVLATVLTGLLGTVAAETFTFTDVGPDDDDCQPFYATYGTKYSIKWHITVSRNLHSIQMISSKGTQAPQGGKGQIAIPNPETQEWDASPYDLYLLDSTSDNKGSFTSDWTGNLVVCLRNSDYTSGTVSATADIEVSRSAIICVI